MIIDFRVRPPVRSFLNLRIFAQLGTFAASVGRALPPSARERSMSALLQEMEASGITHGVIWSRATFDPNASSTNEDVAALVAEHVGRFTGFGAVCVRDPATAVADVDKAITELGLKGIVVEPGFHMPPLHADDPKLYPVYQRCQELGVLLAFTLSGLVGSDLSYCNPVAVDRVAADFPHVSIVISHACWPWVTEGCGVAFRRQNVYLLPDVYGLGMPGHLQWVEAANTYLQDRLLFGSAFPVLGVPQMVEGYQGLPYREEVREKVLYQNAAKLLGLQT
jgi:predicted TIM-barrel fold metal-dependent hydrolase